MHGMPPHYFFSHFLSGGKIFFEFCQSIQTGEGEGVFCVVSLQRIK